MTSAPGLGMFVATFERLVDEGATQILAIHVARSLSAMVSSSRLAAEEWGRLPVTVLDSATLALCTGLQVSVAVGAASGGGAICLPDSLPQLCGRGRGEERGG
jgi:fatty acid-binding protein DegV